MGTQINVTVDSGGLLERSRLQAAANRQAFVEGQQRASAEQTGKEQRLERLAAEGRDAQGNLILPNRARQSALDRFIPQPAARRSGLNFSGLTVFYDRAVLQPKNGIIECSDFLYKDGIKASNLLPQSQEVFTSYQSDNSALLSTSDYPYKHIGLTTIAGGYANEVIDHRGEICTEDEWTYITDIKLSNSGGLISCFIECGDTQIGFGYVPRRDDFYFYAYSNQSSELRYFDPQGFGWLRFSVTYAAANLLLHINGKRMASIPYSISYPDRAFLQVRVLDGESGSLSGCALGLMRFIPRPLYAEEDYIVTPILKIR